MLRPAESGMGVHISHNTQLEHLYRIPKQLPSKVFCPICPTCGFTALLFRIVLDARVCATKPSIVLIRTPTFRCTRRPGMRNGLRLRSFLLSRMEAPLEIAASASTAAAARLAWKGVMSSPYSMVRSRAEKRAARLDRRRESVRGARRVALFTWALSREGT